MKRKCRFITLLSALLLVSAMFLAGCTDSLITYDVYNQFAYFSNDGPGVDILVPGVDILSNGLVEGHVESVLMSGTSMAAAHVSGAALL